MNMKFLLRGALPAATLLAAFTAVPAQASYVCTGVTGSASGNPFFDGDLTDTSCDLDELVLSAISPTLFQGSKTDSIEDDEGNITGWSQDQDAFDLGTLTTNLTSTGGEWSLTGGGITPLFFVVKYDGGYDAYTYMGSGMDPFMDPFSDVWDATNRGITGASCREYGGSINCDANVSHISVYGVVPVPAAVWLFGSGLLGLVGVARRKRT